MQFEFYFRVRGYELDSFGHVNNAVYLNYTEEARWDCLKKAGALDHFIDNKSFLAVIEANIKYIRELKLFQECVIKTKVKMESPYLVFYQNIYSLGNNKKSARVVVKMLHISDDRQALDLPQELLDKLTGEESGAVETVEAE
jgi:YbgC/YbaW family acyl-CoA thioester hydrolase